MEKNITLCGIAYRLDTGESVIDYGIGELYLNEKETSKDKTERISIPDNSICPSLVGTNSIAILPDTEYEARILSISVEAKRMTLSVNDQVGTIRFSNLSEYWGNDTDVLKHYHVDDIITVCLDTTIDTILALKCKDVRIIPWTTLNLPVGTIVSARIRSVEPSLSIWYNGAYFYLNQKDPVAENRIHNHVYYPGMNVRVRVSDVEHKKDGGRHFTFQLVHEHHDYPDISIGTVYPCSIYKRSKFGGLVAAFYIQSSNESIKYSFILDRNEIPSGFDGFYPTNIPSKIRIASFDSLGEPIIHFNSLMEEMALQKEGEVFEITLVKPYINDLPVRIWKSADGLCGTVLKSALYSLGNYQPTGLQGRYIKGRFQVEKRGRDIHELEAGEIIEVAFLKQQNGGYGVSFEGYTGLLSYYDGNIPESRTLSVRIVYVNMPSMQFVCVPSSKSPESLRGFTRGSVYSLQAYSVMTDDIVLGDGDRLCIMPKAMWDWYDGLSANSIELNSVYYKVSVTEDNLPFVYIAERRSLTANPWDTFSSKDVCENVTAKIVRIDGDSTIVDVEGILSLILWSEFSIYNMKFGRLLYMPNDTVTLQVKHFDREKRVLKLKTRDTREQLLSFSEDKNRDWSGVVYRITPNGLIVNVEGLFGFVPKRQMLSNSEYELNQTIPLRLFKKDNDYLEFSHLGALDLTKTCDLVVGQVISDAPYLGIDAMKIWQTYSYKEFIIHSQAWTSRYYSSEKADDFYEKMAINQRFSIRICEIVSNGIYGVPSLMPDYSNLKINEIFEGIIQQITDEYYMVFIPSLNDSFQLLFKEHLCDWGECHFETRKVGDPVSVKMIKYLSRVNFPVFSIKACQEDPWDMFDGKGPIVVKNLGSPNKNKQLFVDVLGVPVSLSYKAICSLFGRPWVDKAFSYDNVEELLGYESFEMEVIRFDKARHHIDLMPLYHAPQSIQMARVVRNKREEPGCWVECGNGLIGYLPNEEIPKGYRISSFVDKAIVKSYLPKDGYAILSIKDLFTELDGIGDTPDGEHEGINVDTSPALKGIEVFEETKLEVGMVVQGIITGMNEGRQFYYVKVGPHTGTIPFNKIAQTKCLLPEFALRIKETYDFQIFKIIPKEESNLLLRLCRHTIAPEPIVDNIIVGREVFVKVVRYSKKDAMIVVFIRDANIEGVIMKDEIAKAFSMPGDSKWKIAYPSVGTRLRATIKGVEKLSNGGIDYITLGRIKAVH